MGIGELPDAALYGDEGSNTLVNIARKTGGLELPNLRNLGLGNIENIYGVSPVSFPTASYGKMTEVSKGKDSTTGHWELAGVNVTFDFSYYPNGFPKDLMQLFLNKTGMKGYLGNKAASGTEIIKELGDEHVKTGFPIVYTSADSVFQIAAHEDIIPLEQLYKICKITREEVLVPPVVIGRVIARPFIGTSGAYNRTTNRKDFSMNPPVATVLDLLQNAGTKTIAIGKVGDLFNYSGISHYESTRSNAEGCNKILKQIQENNGSFIFANLVDFDVYFGHRNDPKGFARALRDFDIFLPKIIGALDDSDLLIITADHGNDPTTPSTDHSREYVPLLVYKKGEYGKNLGTLDTFSDVGKSVAEFFSVANNLDGTSFLR